MMLANTAEDVRAHLGAPLFELIEVGRPAIRDAGPNDYAARFDTRDVAISSNVRADLLSRGARDLMRLPPGGLDLGVLRILAGGSEYFVRPHWDDSGRPIEGAFEVWSAVDLLASFVVEGENVRPMVQHTDPARHIPDATLIRIGESYRDRTDA